MSHHAVASWVALIRAAAAEWNPNPSGENSLHIRWLVNPGESPRANVRLIIADGVVRQISQLPDSQSANALPFVLVPTFVNAHTHLEFSSLPQPLTPALPFTEWIRAVIRFRAGEQAAAATAENNGGSKLTSTATTAGLSESQHSGVTAVGEITTMQLPSQAVSGSSSPVEVVSFRECLGLSSARVAEQLAAASHHVDSLLKAESATWLHPGVSPHAPYSVHPELFDSLVDLARTRHIPLAMHLGETTDELQLLESGSGRFVELLKSVGVWNAAAFPPGRSLMSYLRRLAELPNALAIHGNYLSTDELQFVSQHPNLAVVYCPRTHHYFGHSPHPWRQLLSSGGTVLLGTDSRASNPDLSVWRELQFVSRLAPDLRLAELLPMITTSSAKALGLAADRFHIGDGRRIDGVLLGTHNFRNDLFPSTVSELSAVNLTPIGGLRSTGLRLFH